MTRDLILDLYKAAEVPFELYSDRAALPPWPHETQAGCFWTGKKYMIPEDIDCMTLLHELAHYCTSKGLPSFHEPNFGLDRMNPTHIALEVATCYISLALAYICGVAKKDIEAEMEQTCFDIERFEVHVRTGYDFYKSLPNMRDIFDDLRKDNPEINNRLSMLWHGEGSLL
jgi:hypothetical protein